MLVCEAMLEAIGSIALVAMDACDQGSVDECLAGGPSALLFVIQYGRPGREASC